MPGTIHISVLDLIDLPVPVTSSHSLLEGFLKVAMGKREYRSTGKGDFSFLVVSLRESLVITVHDVNGIQISRTDVKTMVVMEKGEWDSWFVFEGGGRIHLKIRFSITKGDRSRVREMRESAKKRNYENLQRRGLPENLLEAGESKFYPKRDFQNEVGLSENRDTTSGISSYTGLQQAGESSKKDFHNEVGLSQNHSTKSVISTRNIDLEESVESSKQDFRTNVRLSENLDTTSLISPQIDLQESVEPSNAENVLAKNIEEIKKKPKIITDSKKPQNSEDLAEDANNNWKTNIRIDPSYESRKSSNNSILLLNFATQSDIVGNLGDDHMWIKRRICFTTGSKHLMDLYGDFYSIPAAKNLRTDHKEELRDRTNQSNGMIKEKMVVINKNLGKLNPTKIFFALQKYRGNLIIGKVKQITLVVVACGTLILIQRR